MSTEESPFKSWPLTPVVNILAVDDREENLLILEAILKPLGQRLVTACSGEEALSLVLQEDFAVILMDVAMPGMDGFETTRHLRLCDRSRTTPVIFVTAIHTNELHSSQGYALGAVDYLYKPLVPSILQTKVAVFVDLYRKSVKLQGQEALLRQSEASAAEEKYRAEQERHRREELERFAYIAAHDLREPLRAMSIFAHLLQQKYGPHWGEDARDSLGFIVEGASRMRQLIDGLAAYSALDSDSSPPHLINAEQVLATAIRRTARRQTIKAQITHGTLPQLRTNGDHLTQLFQQLISNALKFSEAKTPLEIHVESVLQGSEWLFSVKDNGIGFDPQYTHSIFGLLTRLHPRDLYPGVGMGLAICRRIVEKYAGRIWATSEPGKGSTFFFTLPWTSESEGAPAQLLSDLVSRDGSVYFVHPSVVAKG
jgi:two-component system, sensor histidine kinase and response regulator